MIASVYGPNGIVCVTSGIDWFQEVLLKDDQKVTSSIRMPGLNHVHKLWDKIVLVYNIMDPYTFDTGFIQSLKALQHRWQTPPHVSDFMPYFKKMIVDNNYQIFGVVSAYEVEDGVTAPYVYQIMGESMRRVNLGNDGRFMYNYLCLDRNPVMWKLLKRVKIENGNIWEESEELHLRCDLFSIEKSVDFCCYLVKSSEFVNNINSILFQDPAAVDIVIHKPESIEIRKTTY